MTCFMVIGLLQSCKNSPKNDLSDYKKIYQTARVAEDFNSAIFALTAIASKDSANNAWAFDSLAFYHYFYVATPQTLPNLKAVEYYAARGLEMNRNNHFLLELQAKAVLQQEKDTQAYTTFENLWAATHDYTYLWDMTFIEVGRGNTRRADSLIRAAVNSPDSITGKVRIEVIQARVLETVPMKAAFLYLQAQSILQKPQDLNLSLSQAMPLMREALRIHPNFYSVQQTMYQIQQRLSGRG